MLGYICTIKTLVLCCIVLFHYSCITSCLLKHCLLNKFNKWQVTAVVATLHDS